jgi:hypothetical protein
MRYPLAALILLALPGAASAACVGEYAPLAKYAGGEPSKFLDSPPVKARLKALLGSAEARFKEDLEVSGPVDLIGCELVLNGNAAHQGGERNAVVSFGLYNGKTTAGIYEKGRVTILTEDRTATTPYHYDHLPAHVRDWVLVASGGFRSRVLPPANVVVTISPSVDHH